MGIKRDFEAMGAAVEVSPLPVHMGMRSDAPEVTIDIGTQKGKEFFDIRKKPGSKAEIVVVDRKPKDRHLLLMVKTSERSGVSTKTKYLCGHDEFHWFVAAASPTAADVDRAKESLKPAEVRAIQTRGKKKKRAPKSGVKRQGEWFFLPKKKMKVPHNQILRNEPIQRGRGKPHMVEEVWRVGGTTVYVPSAGFGLRDTAIPKEWANGLSEERYSALMRRSDARGEQATKLTWRSGRVDAKVYGRGRVSHADHSTIKLEVWHQIMPNTESKYVINEQMRFID